MLCEKLIKWVTFIFALVITCNAAATLPQAVEKIPKNVKNDPLFKDGKGYYSYKKPIDIELPKDGRVLIQYFFKYDCNICLNADDYLKQYARLHSDQVILQRSPVYDGNDIFTGQMHATFMQFGREDLSDLFLFDSAGRKESMSLVKSNDAIVQWLTSKGIDAQAFNRLFHSDEVKNRMKQAQTLFNKYKPPYVPIAVLNGKYILLQNTLYNDDYTYGVLDFLVNKLQQEQKEETK
ncbi:thiol:disulfide interchange protein DsbA/DsbL [Actinobacillus pleuropneumoniae]|uniref:thiol:disulfide interchange protein DsbA/DsbL n=1 Tax=Actinobacillus pleuropneumoniae TaxID=715 RepID=UPI003B02370A